MHRSATSLATGALQRLGVHLGPEAHRMPAHPDNPRGYCEHSLLTALNDEILTALGGTWDAPPAAIDTGWGAAARLQDIRKRAVGTVVVTRRGHHSRDPAGLGEIVAGLVDEVKHAAARGLDEHLAGAVGRSVVRRDHEVDAVTEMKFDVLPDAFQAVSFEQVDSRSCRERTCTWDEGSLPARTYDGFAAEEADECVMEATRRRGRDVDEVTSSGLDVDPVLFDASKKRIQRLDRLREECACRNLVMHAAIWPS